MTSDSPDLDYRSLPRWLNWGTISLSILPAVLRLLGFDFGIANTNTPVGVTADGLAIVTGSERGALLHSMYEMAAVGVAILIAGSAVVHYRVSRGVVTAIFALALLFAGALDFFHILASANLVFSHAADPDFVPFTWAMTRIANAAMICFGAGMILFFRTQLDARLMIRHTGLVLGILSAAMILYTVRANTLPQTQFPAEIVKRPADLVPLALYILAGVVLLPMIRRRDPGIFVDSVILSMIPAVAVQLHMAFGSGRLYDHDFYAAHALKVVAYLVPFFGLGLDYLRMRESEMRQAIRRVEAEARRAEAEQRARELAQLARDLERKNRELDQFAYVASHDLRAPLRGISNLSSWLEEDLSGSLTDETRDYLRLMKVRVHRMEAMIDALLQFSRAGRARDSITLVDTGSLVAEIVDLLDPPDGIAVEVAPELPGVRCERIAIQQVFQNLISNAIKYASSSVTIGASDHGGGMIRFSVSDDGPGIAPEYHEKIWLIFQRLESADEKEGTGIGLALVRKIVEGAGGEVGLESAEGDGTTFWFTWPRDAREEGNDEHAQESTTGRR